MTSSRLFPILLFLWCIQGTFSKVKPLATCDMDLPQELHQYLPDQCKNLTSDQMNAAIAESKAYAEWHAKLDDYEKRKDPGFTDIPKKQWILREKITRESLITDCPDNSTVDVYYQCLEDRRQVMINMLSSYSM